MVALGIDDVDGELEKLATEWEEQDARREETAQRIAQKGPAQPPDENPERDEEREAFIAALRDLREALKEGGIGG